MPHADIVFADLCFWIYLALVVVSFYGFCLFVWWKHVVKETSEVYNYVMLLFLCVFLNYSLNIYARFVFINDLTNLNDYEAVISSWVWHFRALPNLIIISLIVYRMDQRARKALKKANKELDKEPTVDRRHDKRRSADRVDK